MKNRERPTGRYTYDPQTLCTCGHPLGDHLAEGKLPERECTVMGCRCRGFHKVRKRNPVSNGKWTNKGRAGWEYTGHGFGTFGVQRTRNGWYAFESPWTGSPVGLGMYGSREAAQKHVENHVAKIAEYHARRKGNPVKGPFSSAQINALRREFAGIDTVNPKRLEDFHRIFAGLGDRGIKQLAGAQIKFVSSLARNELSRRGVKRNPMKKRKRSAAQRAATARLVAMNKKRRGQLRAFAKVAGHPALSQLAREGAAQLRAHRARRAKNPRRKRAITKPAHGYRGYGVIRMQPGTLRVQWMVSPSTWGAEREAMSFGLLNVAKSVAQRSGFTCAVVPFGPGHTAAVQEFIAYMGKK